MRSALRSQETKDMKHLVAACVLALAASSQIICQTTSRQPSPSYPVFDIHMHALNPDFLKPANTANFGPHRRTFGQMVSDPALLLKKTIEYMDKNNVRK